VQKSQKRVYIALVNWKQVDQTLQCLHCISQLHDLAGVVVVDSEVEKPHLSFQNWSHPTLDFQLLHSTQNLGFAEGMNRAIGHAISCGATDIVVLNNDVVIEDSRWLSSMLTSAEKGQASIVGSLVQNQKDQLLEFTGAQFPQLLFSLGRLDPKDEDYPSDYAEGSAMLITADLLSQRRSQCGYYFDPAFFLYCEDVDLCLWAKQNGHSVVMSHKAFVQHATSSSIGPHSAAKFYYLARNRIRLGQRYLHKLKHGFVLAFVLSRWALLRRRYYDDSDIQFAIQEGLSDGLKAIKGKWRLHDEFINAPASSSTDGL
jgi:GT2 family glycosyltransferase